MMIRILMFFHVSTLCSLILNFSPVSSRIIACRLHGVWQFTPQIQRWSVYFLCMLHLEEINTVSHSITGQIPKIISACRGFSLNLLPKFYQKSHEWVSLQPFFSSCRRRKKSAGKEIKESLENEKLLSWHNIVISLWAWWISAVNFMSGFQDIFLKKCPLSGPSAGGGK